MKPTLAFAAFFTLLSFSTASRPGPGVMKENAIPEVIRDIVHFNPDAEIVLLPSHANKPDRECDTMMVTSDGASSKLAHHLDKERKGFTVDFEPRPNIFIYGGDDNKVKTKTKYADDFEPRPNISSYGGDETTRKYGNDFEPRPNISAYGGDDK